MSSWCDKLASTPAVGLRMSSHHFVGNSRILDSLSPILDRHVDTDRNQQAFAVELPNEFSVNVKTHVGFTYGVDSERVHVTFNHMMRPKAVSGHPPIMEMLSTPQPYTKLLDEVIERLIEAALLVPNEGSRSVKRIGLISVTAVDQEDLPPGIVKMISHFSSPWKRDLVSFTLQANAALEKTSGRTDNCVHTMLKSDIKGELLNIQFDYQRVFEDARRLERTTLETEFRSLSADALGYFEKVAEGDMFDAN